MKLQAEEAKLRHAFDMVARCAEQYRDELLVEKARLEMILGGIEEYLSWSKARVSDREPGK